MYCIKSDFKGANIRVISAEQNMAVVEPVLRGTTLDNWFYWCFKVENAGGKTLRFEFLDQARVGYYGAAVSHDYKNWHWQYETVGHQGNSFTYIFGEDENEVYFAHDKLYRPERFYHYASQNGIKLKTFCISEKGRPVPYVDTEKGERCIVLTARHHACESTGNYVLEGVLADIIQAFSKDFRIICIPFMDFDGVVDGDQGKNRFPYDHNRDYQEYQVPIYQTVRRLRELTDPLDVKYAFDFHSPWHLGRENDTLFIPHKLHNAVGRVRCFSELFEAENTPDTLPHYADNDKLPDVDWNHSDSTTFGRFFGLKGAELSFTVETPYFMASETIFTPTRAKESGKAFVRALEKYEAEYAGSH